METDTGPMKYLSMPVSAYQQNCSLLWCEKSLKAVIVDPGGDVDRIASLIEQQGVEPVAIYLTHAHLDHVGGTPELAKRFDLPVIGPHIDDKYWIDALQQQVEMFSFPPCEQFEPDQWLEHGDTLEFGEQKLEVLHCPGHTPGHVVFFHRDSEVAFVGDVIFQGSIGRTDFPGGSHQQLLDSIRFQLWPLGDNVTVVSGHGPETTIGEERNSNPFLRGA